MKKIIVKTSLRKYPIYFGNKILSKALELIKDQIGDFNKVLLITNDTINALYRNDIEDICNDLGTEYEIIIFRDGEKYKSLESAREAYSRLIDLNFHRNDVLIAFGGGVIGDTGGFIASTFHRGMKLVHIPTTIIGQVDSSIGGKVVVNFSGKKNIIGSFYQPHMIIMDPLVLKTLDEKQILNGLGEIVKYGLVFEKNIISVLKEIIDREDYRINNITEHENFRKIICKCAKIKAKVVEKDEFDTGYRNLLNFGHTIGHSIENVSGLKDINHGQAVSMGMIAALEISTKLGIFPEKNKEEIKLFFQGLGIPHEIPDIDVKKIVEGLKYDKKFTSRTNRFILLKSINKPIFYEGIEENIIVDSINNCINK
jgi:3-dehydroquinate synthase